MGATPEAPAARHGLGQQHPCATRKGRIARCFGDERRELLNDRELLIAVQRARIRKHLDAHVARLAVDVGDCGRRQLADEGRRVLTEHRDIGNPFDPHQCPCRRRGELVRVGKGAGRCVDVDHGHGISPPLC